MEHERTLKDKHKRKHNNYLQEIADYKYFRKTKNKLFAKANGIIRIKDKNVNTYKFLSTSYWMTRYE